MGRPKKLALTLAVSLGAIAAVWLAFIVFTADDPAPADAGEAEAASTSETTQVVRRTLKESESVDGTVSHGTPIPLSTDAAGLVTQAPQDGQILSPGEVVLRIDDRPVTLVAGEFPMYRELRKVSSSERDIAGKRLGLQTGADIEQLQTFLTGLGFDDSGRMETDGIFGAATEKAVKAWQASVGLPQTGRVDRTQIVFIDGDIRVEEAPAAGQRFERLMVTDTSQKVTVSLSRTKRPFFPEGATVSIEADGQTLEGTITDVSRSTGVDGSTRYAAEASVETGLIPEGVDTAELTADRTIATDVLTLPVRALLALAEGGWAVQLPTETGTGLARVELSQVVDGIAEISGIQEGTEVVVPQ